MRNHIRKVCFYHRNADRMRWRLNKANRKWKGLTDHLIIIILLCLRFNCQSCAVDNKFARIDGAIILIAGQPGTDCASGFSPLYLAFYYPFQDIKHYYGICDSSISQIYKTRLRKFHTLGRVLLFWWSSEWTSIEKVATGGGGYWFLSVRQIRRERQ